MSRTAFEMSFDQWPPLKPQARHGVSAPLGAIRFEKNGRSQTRYIKVHLDGPPSRRWMTLARFWWLRNRGPVPADKRVGHLDGDTLNDDPSNYALFSPGDVIASWHLDNPEASERQRERCRIGTAKCNRERGEVRRQRQRLPSRWYLVDVGRRVIINQPRKSQRGAYAVAGFSVPSRNGMGLAVLLGWTGVSASAAAAMAVLAEHGAMRAGELRRRVADICRARRWKAPQSKHWIVCLMVDLRKRGWVGGRRGWYELTQDGRLVRGPVCRYILVRGRELAGEEFRSFELRQIDDLERGAA